jgi:2-amino-4-hydroxy-6-hydroxymethyldihydropteridine diphosphokinase
MDRLPCTKILRFSRVYETSPVGPRQRDFLNAAAELRTALPPVELFRALKRIERSLGRRTGKKWGPREIDLDLLFYGSRRVGTAALRIPHPRLHERKFVLRPLADIAPRFRDPVTRLTAAALLRRLTAPDQRVNLYKRAIL